MIVRERQGLETMQAFADYFYEKTEDPWYQKISKMITQKLEGSKK